jgi:serine/threonine protein kinase
VDFGFTCITAISQGTTSFVAPELILSTKFGLDKGIPSKEADIYALGVTVYQVLMGK